MLVLVAAVSCFIIGLAFGSWAAMHKPIPSTDINTAKLAQLLRKERLERERRDQGS